ncbi:MAG: energy-coupled thiamine transporter ThiT [Candidatus Wallbacteria bacterium]|nr:energy-coupled thiamine transporter ThiT [Candidatus Wallbacteria bacterium]
MPSPELASSSPATARIAEAGMALALAFVLKVASVRIMPAGGGVSLAALAPLWLFAMRHGAWRGAGLGASFGALQLMLRPEVVHWAQALLDYPVAFASVGAAALPWGQPVAGCVLATLARYGAHVASGVVFWSSAAPAGVPVLQYALAYNLYVFPDALVAALALGAISRRIPAARLVAKRP